MAITRVGLTPNGVPHSKHLGRVLVTIDDLQALMELLSDRQVNSTGAPLSGVQFQGGTFTDPEDLRRLSDEEARSLRGLLMEKQTTGPTFRKPSGR